MANRRQMLLSQLKSNLDIVSKAIGVDRDKSNVPDHIFPNDHGPSDVDMRFSEQNFDNSHTYRTARYPDTYGTDGGTYSQGSDREFYNERYDASSERAHPNESYGRVNAKTFRSPTAEIEAEETFLYASDKPVEGRSHDYGYSDSASEQSHGVRRENGNLSYEGHSASTKPQLYEDVRTYVKGKIEPGTLSSSRTSEETLENIFKTIGLDSSVSSLVHNLLKKDSAPNQNRPQSTGAFNPDLEALDADVPGQETREKDWDTQHFLRETENFLNRIAPKTLPNNSQVPFGSRYSPPPSRYTPPPSRYTPPPLSDNIPVGSAQHHLPMGVDERPYGSRYSPVVPRVPEHSFGSQFSAQRADEYLVSRCDDLGTIPANGRDAAETHLYFKPKAEPTASAQHDSRRVDSVGAALNETVSNIRVLENALVNLGQTKTSIMLRPPGSQRDSLLLENLRMQEEINGQMDLLQDTANELSQRMKAILASGSADYQPDVFVSTIKRSPLNSMSRSPKRSSWDSGEQTSRRTRHHSPGRRSRSRSRDRRTSWESGEQTSRRTRRHSPGRRSRSRSRERRRYSRSRSHERRRSHGRRRSRDRRRSRARDSSESDREAPDFAAQSKTAAEKAEDKERKALELALSMYLAASEYYNGTNVWCQKCGIVFDDVHSLCQHLHSEKHQIVVDPEFNKPRPPCVPDIPLGVKSAPSRGYEFVLPLQAFFCSLCCEFMKDISKAEEHLKSIDHNKKFKVFLNDNHDYELKFLKDVTTAIANNKAASDSQALAVAFPEAPKNPKGFMNPENEPEEKFRGKFQFKIAGATKQAAAASKSPDVEIVDVTQRGGMVGKKNKISRFSSDFIAASKAAENVSKQIFKNSEPRIDHMGRFVKANTFVSMHTATVARNLSSGSKGSAASESSAKSGTVDMFSFDQSTSAESSGLSKSGRFQNRAQKTVRGKVLSDSIIARKEPDKKPEEAVVNIRDFEILDEC